MNPLPSQAGFSLVEVLLAVLILGIALVGLTEGMTSALTSSKASETQTTAAMLAAGQIETLRAAGSYENGETEGDFGDEFPQYHWAQTIANADISGLYDVDVVIEDSRTGKTLYDLRTMLFELPQGTNSVSHSQRPGHRREREQ